MNFITFILWFLAVVLVAFAGYVIIRLWSWAWYKSKLDFEKEKNQLRSFFGLERRNVVDK